MTDGDKQLEIENVKETVMEIANLLENKGVTAEHGYRALKAMTTRLETEFGFQLTQKEKE